MNPFEKILLGLLAVLVLIVVAVAAYVAYKHESAHFAASSGACGGPARGSCPPGQTCVPISANPAIYACQSSGQCGGQHSGSCPPGQACRYRFDTSGGKYYCA